MDEAHGGGDDDFVDVVNPETGLRAGEGVIWEKVFAVCGISIFEEFVDDQGLV